MRITKTEAAFKCHMRLVFKDPEFKIPYDKLRESNDPDKYEKQEELLQKFGIDWKSEPPVTEPPSPAFLHYRRYTGGVVRYDDDNKRFIATMTSTITREQLLDLWRLLQSLKKKNEIVPTKQKPPEDPELLYAIFKMRMTKRSFREIFSKYQAGNLPGYKNRTTNQFSSDDSLERHYRKHYRK